MYKKNEGINQNNNTQSSNYTSNSCLVYLYLVSIVELLDACQPNLLNQFAKYKCNQKCSKKFIYCMMYKYLLL